MSETGTTIQLDDALPVTGAGRRRTRWWVGIAIIAVPVAFVIVKVSTGVQEPPPGAAGPPPIPAVWVRAGGDRSSGVHTDEKTFYYAITASSDRPLRTPVVVVRPIAGLHDQTGHVYLHMTALEFANATGTPSPRPVPAVGPSDFLVVITGRIDCSTMPTTGQVPEVSISFTDGGGWSTVPVMGMQAIDAGLMGSACGPQATG
jgi:hypothetical protein